MLAVFAVALYRGHGEHDARALTFTTLIVANLGLIFANRSWTRTLLEHAPHAECRAVVGLRRGDRLSLPVLYVPFLRDLFHFSTLHPNDLLLCLAAGVVSVLWFEALKLMRRRPERTELRA